MFLISLPEPCHQKWEEMDAIERGAYCKSCNKEVIDFTCMNDAELFNYLKSTKFGSACGRFRNDQLREPIPCISPDVIYMNIPLWKKFIAILFICFSSFITGCDTQVNHDASKTQFPFEAKKIASIAANKTHEDILEYHGNAAPVRNIKRIKKINNLNCVEVSCSSGRYYVLRKPDLGDAYNFHFGDSKQINDSR